MHHTNTLLAELLGNNIQWLQGETRLLQQILAAEPEGPLSERVATRLAAAQARMGVLVRTREGLEDSVGSDGSAGP
jgi:hypothetical protein